MTVVYYTSNRENERFEGRIREAIMQAKGELPLISVSQKPIDFGQNICVGDVGASSQNAYRQLLIGAQEAKTRFVCTAESDCVYSPEYFAFIPEDEKTFYMSHPFWILFAQKGKIKVFARKERFVRGSNYTDAPFVVGRQTLIDRLMAILEPLGGDKWGDATANGQGWPYMLNEDVQVKTFDASTVSFKTDQNMHRVTPWQKGTSTRSLKEWGTATEMVETYCG